ncbi:enterochelin esterase-like enzyme/mannose-6-phosphate isomerase-like protein (cupin superfamily) [Catalinimonas alkaloidigena]|uniref:alpha/beta hydrolase-fold protein n=1 Tax=Catalinimonas alkaloidigena TaxID=1075417 RepID=UPI002404C723|nr:alpha/beta hydrolase-fold protein [Catalinimonas alkaloidigena]MDF9797252.1 enterochelin esterase-like enzyme/mannose-6-phosphate isomerase-like protein (cupin superfamily) [Catalinimonas alkaloidigena]
MYKYVFLICFLMMSYVGNSQKLYDPGPNSNSYKGIPKGTLTQHSWESKIYPNTSREYYVYVPAQYNPDEAAALMIFQDGHTYIQEDGDFRVPTVFDNLISQGNMPVTLGLFINPGHDIKLEKPETPWRASNRSLEYDDVSDTYARFLIEEMIPELKKQYNISDDPKMRAICGISSGGISAFTAAWFYPEQFHKVLSHIGSFTDIRGGHNYPSMIRKNDKKAIKVFLQDGENDLNNQFGNWWLANQQMASALAFKNYEYRFAEGKGAHDGNHGGAILPESLTWLWRDVSPQIIKSQVHHFPKHTEDSVMISGESMHFKEIEFKTVYMNSAGEEADIYDEEREQIFIIKNGEVNVKLKGRSKTIGKNSVLVLLPGDKATLASATPEAIFYTMNYISKKEMDTRRGRKAGGSAIIDFDALEFRAHDKGGVRNFFHRATSMCPYYEMHVTNLNPGIKSHEPHTHEASEIILMIEGESEMEIGNDIFPAKGGDVYFISSNVAHAIKNIGEKQCRYFAFQWE